MVSNSNVKYYDSKLISSVELIIKSVYQDYKIDKNVDQTKSQYQIKVGFKFTI